jgi:hypothetical protein
VNGIGLVFLVVAVALALRLERAIRKAEKENDACSADLAWSTEMGKQSSAETGT